VIFKEEWVGGRARVTIDEERLEKLKGEKVFNNVIKFWESFMTKM